MKIREALNFLNLTTSKRQPMPPIIVNTPGYNEKTGGTIVMHYLVDRLRHLGFEAYVYPWVDAQEYSNLFDRGEAAFASVFSELTEKYDLNPRFNASIASYKQLKRCIAVYPLRVKGNPLRAETVIRWHIYKKSYIPDAEFSRGEFDFFYNDSFFEGEGQVDASQLLRLSYEFTEYYFETDSQVRSSNCYMVRKGTSYSERAMQLIPKDAICIDGLDHLKVAEIFNMSKHFYCFDLYTAYEYYAAVCGCIPIVMPAPGLSKTQWRKKEEERYGVAYGPKETDWAKRTRGALLARQRESRRAELETVRNFSKFLAEKYK